MKRCSSRWDKETPIKMLRLQESQNIQESSLTISTKESKRNGSSLEVCSPFGECSEQLGQVVSDLRFQMPVGDLQGAASLNGTTPAQHGDITVVLSGKKLDDRMTHKPTNQMLEGGQRNFLDTRVDSSMLSEKQSEPSEQQKHGDVSLTKTSIEALIGLKRLSIGEDVIRTAAETRPVTPATTRYGSQQ